MTDYTRLRQLAERVTADTGGWWTAFDPPPGLDGTDDAEFIAAATPDTILELLDEIEALRRGQGRAPAPAKAGPAPAPLHETHPIPDSTKEGKA